MQNLWPKILSENEVLILALVIWIFVKYKYPDIYKKKKLKIHLKVSIVLEKKWFAFRQSNLKLLTEKTVFLMY